MPRRTVLGTWHSWRSIRAGQTRLTSALLTLTIARYLPRTGGISGSRAIEDVDRKGVRMGISSGSAYDLFLVAAFNMLN